MGIRNQYSEGGLLAVAGYLLSPLSFWNELFINFPIAFAFAFLFGIIHEALFAPVMIIVYWITNVLGFVLIQKGIIKIKGDEHVYDRKALIRDVAFGMVYTVLIVGLILADVISFPEEWLDR